MMHTLKVLGLINRKLRGFKKELRMLKGAIRQLADGTPNSIPLTPHNK